MERTKGEVVFKLLYTRLYDSMNQVDGAVAVVDPRLGEFKEQFMLPVGSVIPKYVLGGKMLVTVKDFLS